MQIPLTMKIIDGMCNLAEFKVNDLSLDIPNTETPTLVMLRLREEKDVGIPVRQAAVKSLYPISGFPRTLIREDEETGTWGRRSRQGR
jgi:hypothetical protein